MKPTSENAKRETVIRCAQAMATSYEIPFDEALDAIQEVLRSGEREVFENVASR